MTVVLITGGGGQLGRELGRCRWPDETTVIVLESHQLDITDRDAVRTAVVGAKPDVIINAAGFTAVDAAEDRRDRAFDINGTAVGHLAAAANAAAAVLIHISTDYVFDGSKVGWYTEDDPVGPLGVYARSKVAGELAAAEAERSIILRTAWLYGALGSNFVTTVLRLAAEGQDLRIVDDQTGCPTSAADVADAVATLITRGLPAQPGRHLYHLASPEPATWFELAEATIDASKAGLGFAGRCYRISTEEYPTAATRPRNSRLSSSLIADDFGIQLPAWRDSLPLVVAELEGGYDRSR